ncbi:hypothetical protein [Paenibacillus polymyxa]|uniref:hypothetical protein n=1 Tax=Paenibacillus polymyxa TaxID=1406 RepID=UPI003D2E4CDD
MIEQSLDKASYEIIVVNNDYQNDEIHHLVREFRATYNIDDSFMRYMEAPLKGLSLHVMLVYLEQRVKSYSILMMMLSRTPTCLKRPSEASQIVRISELWVGNIILNLHEERPEVVKPGTEAYWSQLIVEGEEIIDSNFQWSFLMEPTLRLGHAALMRIGGFRSAYGRKGNNYAGGEEIVVSFAMREIGYKVWS